MYCQNRYYDPANGRWLTRDPIGTAGGLNLYSYCGAGPVGNTDPSGLVSDHEHDGVRAKVTNRSKVPVKLVFDKVVPIYAPGIPIPIGYMRVIYTIMLPPGATTTAEIDPDYIYDPKERKWYKTYGGHEYEVHQQKDGYLVINSDFISDIGHFFLGTIGRWKWPDQDWTRNPLLGYPGYFPGPLRPNPPQSFAGEIVLGSPPTSYPSKPWRFPRR